MKINIIGSSHSKLIGCYVDNIKPGIKINYDIIKSWLELRRGILPINTTRIEDDPIIFLTGVKENQTIGGEFYFVVENKNYKSKDYPFGIVRPSHADIVGYQVDSNNFEYQGGGKFSGRMSVLYVILGAILSDELDKNIKINAHIKQIGEIYDTDLNENTPELNSKFPVIDHTVKEQMLDKLKSVKKNGDSHGAKLSFMISNIPVGVGGYFFDSFESQLARRLFAIGGVKAIEFGMGVDYASSLGSNANDQLDVKNNQIYSKTNKQGGINGGFTNGIAPVTFSVTMRPTPTIFKKQQTVRFEKNGEIKRYELLPSGRHDAFIANRAVIVIKALSVITLYEMIGEDI